MVRAGTPWVFLGMGAVAVLMGAIQLATGFYFGVFLLIGEAWADESLGIAFIFLTGFTGIAAGVGLFRGVPWVRKAVAVAGAVWIVWLLCVWTHFHGFRATEAIARFAILEALSTDARLDVCVSGLLVFWLVCVGLVCVRPSLVDLTMGGIRTPHL